MLPAFRFTPLALLVAGSFNAYADEPVAVGLAAQGFPIDHRDRRRRVFHALGKAGSPLPHFDLHMTLEGAGAHGAMSHFVQVIRAWMITILF